MDWRDRPTDVRAGESLDNAAMASYLETHFPDFAPPLSIQQFPGGYSNLTYQLSWGEIEWILRRPPPGAQIKSGHDMSREFRILQGLAPGYNKVPKSLIYCDNPAVIGAPFYIMERLDGVIMRTGMPPEMHPGAAIMNQIAGSFIETLAELHTIDYERAGLASLGKPRGYISRQVIGWNQRYTKSQTDEIPHMDVVGKWLIDHQPEEGTASLIHNDFKYDNLILHADDWTQIIGILDWEMATLGDPLMDLGTTLGYWVEPDDPPAMQALKLSPTTLPGNPTRAALAEQYCAITGHHLENLVFYYAYGLFKIGVIVQQIYARYKKGHTTDERFAGLIHAVKACSEMANQAIQLNRIDKLF